MKTARLFMVTTPVDQYNFFSKLIQRVHPETGLPLFHVVHPILACTRCIDLGRASYCTHKLKFLPPWKSKDSMSVIREIMKDHEVILQREQLGMIKDVGDAYIPENDIEEWFNSKRYTPARGLQSKVVIVCMDPNGGDSSTASEQAIVSIALVYGMEVVRFCALSLFGRIPLHFQGVCFVFALFVLHCVFVFLVDFFHLMQSGVVTSGCLCLCLRMSGQCEWNATVYLEGFCGHAHIGHIFAPGFKDE